MLTNLKEHLKKKDTWLSGFFKLIELVLFYCMVKVILRAGRDYLEKHATGHTREFFAKAAAAGATADGTTFLVVYGSIIIAVLVIPSLYFMVWIHRLDKWITINDLKRKFKRENETLVLDNQNNPKMA